MLKLQKPVRSYSGEFKKTNTANKKYLSKDFYHRCAYCDDLDSISGGYKTFHVEHFAPKEKFPDLVCTYENLLYSCPYCNCSKNDDWPSNDSLVSVVGNKGYIDPCSEDYHIHLDRDNLTGTIYAKTELGKYMYNKLQLYLLRHSLIYMLDKLKQKRDQLQQNIDRDKKNGKDVFNEENLLAAVNKEFFMYYDKFNLEQST